MVDFALDCSSQTVLTYSSGGHAASAKAILNFGMYVFSCTLHYFLILDVHSNQLVPNPIPESPQIFPPKRKRLDILCPKLLSRRSLFARRIEEDIASCLAILTQSISILLQKYHSTIALLCQDLPNKSTIHKTQHNAHKHHMKKIAQLHTTYAFVVVAKNLAYGDGGA